jgi:ankyrin repeat protein
LPNLVQVLLDDGVDADAHGKLYGTAIQAAAGHGSQEVFKLLLAAGADINITGGKYGHTLAAAVASRNEDIVLMLKGKDIKTEQKILNKALDEAASWGNVPSMEFLLDLGADPNTKRDNKTVLETAIENDHEAAVQLLLRRGVDKSALSPEILRVQNDGILVQLLDLGVDQFAVCSNGWTALSFATSVNAEAVVQVLLERPGADSVLMPGISKHLSSMPNRMSMTGFFNCSKKPRCELPNRLYKRSHRKR